MYTGDALVNQNGSKFSTSDSDNDSQNGNCATIFTYGGAGWYNNCYHANPNGHYLQGDTDNKHGGIVWYEWHRFFYSLRVIEMKIRPSNFRS